MSKSEKQVSILRVMSHVDAVGVLCLGYAGTVVTPGFQIHQMEQYMLLKRILANTSTCFKVHCDSPKENNCVREWKYKLPVHLTASLA